MEHGVDRDRFLLTLVENSIRKTTYQCTAIALMNEGEHIRLAADGFDTPIDRTQEFPSQSDSTAFVPSVGFRNIQLASGAMTSSAAIAAADPAFHFFPRQS